MAARLQRLLDSQQQLLRDISHDLRSPLARLRIATELARDTHTEAQFDRIELEADKLEDMIAQLLLIARLEHRETPLATEIFALDEILESVCEDAGRSEEHTSELQSLMRISYAVFCLKKKNTKTS